MGSAGSRQRRGSDTDAAATIRSARRATGRLGHERAGELARSLEEGAVGAEAREAEVAEARLARAEELALAAELEVALGELEPVRCLDERLEPACATSVSSSFGLEISRQYDCSAPRPTRPRSWWSCASPNRSASWTIMIVAFGTSTPTSITVVATSTCELAAP